MIILALLGLLHGFLGGCDDIAFFQQFGKNFRISVSQNWLNRFCFGARYVNFNLVISFEYDIASSSFGTVLYNFKDPARTRL